MSDNEKRIEQATASDMTKFEEYCISVITGPDGACDTCLRQGCAHRDGTIRVNCPLWQASAV